MPAVNSTIYLCGQAQVSAELGLKHVSAKKGTYQKKHVGRVAMDDT